MFSEKERYERLGDYVSETPLVTRLIDVEKYFAEAVEPYPFETSHDCNANERLYFKTMNYTSYAGCFIMHPLQPELALRQTTEAIRHDTKLRNYTQHFADIARTGDANKYNEIKAIPTEGTVEALVVLMGGNKIEKHMCINKLKFIVNEHGHNVVVKPHPLTPMKMLNDLRTHIPDIQILGLKDDLFPYMLDVNVKKIYTSHLSETACYAASLGKEIEPIDTEQSRVDSSFNHINYHIFMEENKISTINKMFSSFKSGVVNPDVDEDWKEKIDLYLEYIDAMRTRMRYYYV